MSHVLVFAAGFSVLCAVSVWADPVFDVPDPATTEHPGAQAAPASSPATYPDAAGFAARRQVVIEGLAEGGLDKWRKGYFTGGDPGKYLPGHAMAKLLLNPDDPEPAQYMNDNRSYKEHYHFACVNWARYYPIFGPRTLTQETMEKFADAGFKYGSYLNHSGTENHKTMWWTSACVIPQYTGKGLSRNSKEATLAKAKQTLRSYVKTLLHHGAGEWDSSTYLMFTANGLMNIYDFSDDPEMRLIAKAGLDCMLTSYALKYTDGVFCAPNQRGHADGPYETITDQTGYVWWGGHKELTAQDTRGFRCSLHAITSSYRPNAVMTNLARQQLPDLPAEFRNTRANYWHGQSIPARPATHETLYLDKAFTMGTLWNGYASQHTRFQIVVPTEAGGVTLTAGHPRKSDHTGKKTGLGYADGISRYAQFAQVGSTTIILAKLPADEESRHLFLTLPEQAVVSTLDGGAYAVGINDKVWLKVSKLGGAIQEHPAEGEGKHRIPRTLRTEAVKPDDGSGVGALVIEAISDMRGDAVKDAAKFEADPGKPTATYTDRHGKRITMTFNPDPDGDNHGDRPAEVAVDGVPIDFKAWSESTISGPYVHQSGGVMSINDGTDGFVIDFTGDLPVYKQWKAQ